MKHSFIRSVGVAAIVLSSSSLSAVAYDFEADGFYYNILSEENRTAEVTYKAYHDGAYKGDITIPQVCSRDGEEYAVVAIGSEAFYLCSSMTSINLPGSITAIGDRAFVSCSSLTSIDIPGSVTSIGEMAFSTCKGLTLVNIPASVTSIAKAVFVCCDALTTITVDSDNQAYCSLDGILYDKSQSSILCCPAAKMDEIRIPDSVTTIIDQAFRGCIGLTSLTLPGAVTTIGNMAFLDCRNLKSIDLPNSLTTIGSGAFASGGLTVVAIPASVTAIADGAFSGCQILANINVDGDNPEYSSIDGILYNKSQTCVVFCPAGKEGEITIPGTVAAIGSRAFEECHELTSITIPGSVTSIGNSAFANCFRLQSVYVEWKTPIEECSDWAFGGRPSATLYVPRGCVAAYSAVEPWSNFRSIEEYNFTTGIDEVGRTDRAAVQVYNVDGAKVADAPENLPAGIYIIRAGSTSRKIIIR